MRRTILAIGLLVTITLAAGGCWPWEDRSLPQTPAPTASPPKVEDAGHSSPSVQGRLLYARAGNIWLRSGTSAERLTEGIWATQPCWSPDGRQITFVVKEEGYSDIWIMAADASNQYAVTANSAQANPGTFSFAHHSYWAFQPQWIPPSGEWIGYVSHIQPIRLTTPMSIWLIRPDGTGEYQHLYWGDAHIESPVWSPDGESLAFTLHTVSNGAQLRYLDVNGNRLPLGEDVAGIERYDPAWSPDGDWIAYAARQGGRTDLWLMPSPQNPLYEAEWSPLRLTQRGTARGPAWSPTGRQIAFVAEENDSFDLWLLNLDLTTGAYPGPAREEKLTNGANVDATARPSWAP